MSTLCLSFRRRGRDSVDLDLLAKGQRAEVSKTSTQPVISRVVRFKPGTQCAEATLLSRGEISRSFLASTGTVSTPRRSQSWSAASSTPRSHPWVFQRQ